MSFAVWGRGSERGSHESHDWVLRGYHNLNTNLMIKGVRYWVTREKRTWVFRFVQKKKEKKGSRLAALLFSSIVFIQIQH